MDFPHSNAITQAPPWPFKTLRCEIFPTQKPESDTGIFPSQSLGFAAPLIGFSPLESECEPDSVVRNAPLGGLAPQLGFFPLRGCKFIGTIVRTRDPLENHSPNQHLTISEHPYSSTKHLGVKANALKRHPIPEENMVKQTRQDPSNTLIDAFTINFRLHPFKY